MNAGARVLVGQNAVTKAAGWSFTDVSIGLVDARTAPPVTGSPPVGVFIPMVNVDPVGAVAIDAAAATANNIGGR